MDPLIRPEFLLLLLEQGDRSLEDHTRLFLLLANATSYPDNALCSFYDASLNTASRALWTLARNRSPLTICPVDDLARSTPDPEPSPPSPRVRSISPSPPMMESYFPPRSASQRKAERLSRGSPWKLSPSDQVREPATVPTTREQAVDGVSAEWSSAPCTAAEGELIIQLGLLDFEGNLIDWETDLEIELPPLLSPSTPLVPSSPPSSLVPLSSAEGASDPPVPAPRKCPPVRVRKMLLENARPPTHSFLLNRCHLAAPLLTLSPPSLRCEPRGTAILQRCRGRSIPHLRLQPPRPGLCLGP